jgi:signal transduction histidine kinase
VATFVYIAHAVQCAFALAVPQHQPVRGTVRPLPDPRRVAGEAACSLGSPDFIEHVCPHLLSNARQHTPAIGRINSSVRRAPDDGVQIYVSDSGDGLDLAHLPFVFDRFYRADRWSRSRAMGGTGLGLAIVRQVVVSHGGQVRAESDGRGKGSRFTVMLPLTPAHAADACRGMRSSS